MESSLVLLLILIILSGAFSGAEIALTSLTPAKVKTLKNDKRFGSKAVFKLKSKPERLLITILIGNNLVNILATVVATVWGLSEFGDNAIGIVTGVLTFIILVFGEITPKTFAQKHAEGFSRIMANPLLWFTYLLYPIVWLLNKFIHSLMRIFNAQNPMSTMSEEELLAMVDIGTKEGVIEEHEQEFIENVLEFTDTNVEEVMTIAKDIEMISADTTIQNAAHFFVEHTHSRIPVFKGNSDNVIGIVTVHDVVRLMNNPGEYKTLEDLHYQKVIIVPKTKSINKLFLEFKKRRHHIALVVDEHGKIVGLVTLEDILEEIVGDIADEKDREESSVKKIGKNEWEVDGDATIEELNTELKTKFNYPEHQTISLLILEKLQGFPNEGEIIQQEGFEIRVTVMSKKKIEKVVITKMNGNN
ncbi:HlyC/CorC family transporter [Candidatus Peregrinibacteria bacterium]|nr:HlyC/CorC family transporter [Candidatus Peregrinibacteria bacterium]